MKKIALFDLDNTLADFDGQMKRDLANLRSPGEPPLELYQEQTPTWLDRRMDAIKNQPGWWENLPIRSEGFHILDAAMDIGFEIQILTKGPRRKSPAWSEKVRWAQGQLGPGVNITITQDKSSVYGRVLVDDYPDYVEGWLKVRPRGLVIMPRTVYNEGYVHARALHYDGTDRSLGDVRKALQEAYDRPDGLPVLKEWPRPCQGETWVIRCTGTGAVLLGTYYEVQDDELDTPYFYSQYDSIYEVGEYELLYGPIPVEMPVPLPEGVDPRAAADGTVVKSVSSKDQKKNNPWLDEQERIAAGRVLADGLIKEIQQPTIQKSKQAESWNDFGYPAGSEGAHDIG